MSWREIVEWAELRWPAAFVPFGERTPWFWRFCRWATHHGLLMRPANVPDGGFYRDFLPNWRFWLGPYWQTRLGREGHHPVARLRFRDSLRETWWMITGRGEADWHTSLIELFSSPRYLELQYAKRKLVQTGVAIRSAVGRGVAWVLGALEASALQYDWLCRDRQLDRLDEACAREVSRGMSWLV